MQVENTSARLWTVRDIKCIPGQVTEIPDEFAADIVGHQDLKVVKAKEAAETVERAKPGRKAKEAEPEAAAE